jgi:hypothetical protein
MMPHEYRMAIAAALTAFALFASAAPVPKHLMKDKPYWLTAVGTKWVYVQNEQEWTEEITRADAIQGGTHLTVRGRYLDDTYDVTPDGVTERTAGQFTLDSLIMRFPIKTGDSWAFAYPIQNGLLCEGGKVAVGAEEDIKVAAGTFRATKVVCTVTEVNGKPVNKPYTYTHWYAKGVGTIRVEWANGSRELKSFTPAPQ